MASSTYKFSSNQPGGGGGGFAAENGDADDGPKESSLSKTFGNVMNLVNDGLYRIKNRNKSELVIGQQA